MKKNVLLTLISILSLALVPTDTYGQGFLKKLKQKVEKAVGMEEPTEESNLQEETEEGETPKGTVTATDRLPKLHTVHHDSCSAMCGVRSGDTSACN